jgi:dienelactone hydrolase
MGHVSSSNDTTATKLANVKVVVTEPQEGISPKGVTLLLPGSSAPLAHVNVTMYNSLRDVLVQQGQQVVIGYYEIAVLTASHETFARRAANVMQAYWEEHPNMTPKKYNIVGHSVGAKIALLLAAKVDPKNLQTVVALDPVDDKPPQFTNESGENLSLKNKDDNTIIYMTWAAATPTGKFGVNPARNANAIYDKNKDFIAQFVRQDNASHFCYTDTGTGPLISGGTSEGNQQAREQVQRLLGEIICPGTTLSRVRELVHSS